MQIHNVPLETAISQIALAVNTSLDKGSVLLLLSGGSNVQAAVEIRKQIALDGKSLAVGLIDERYGPVGHADSNWKQLVDAGFDLNGVQSLPVLSGLSFEETVGDYERRLQNELTSHDTIIGIFGLGTDGHTSGVLPSSPAVTSTQLVAGYQGPDYQRVTTTPMSFGLFDIAYLVAYGPNKAAQLGYLRVDLPINTQPAQALKSSKEFIVYNDQVDVA